MQAGILRATQSVPAAWFLPSSETHGALWPVCGTCSCSSPFPPRFSPFCPPSNVSVHGSFRGVCVCWAGNPFLNYSCSTCCNYKARDQRDHSYHLVSDVIPTQLFLCKLLQCSFFVSFFLSFLGVFCFLWVPQNLLVAEEVEPVPLEDLQNPLRNHFPSQ